MHVLKIFIRDKICSPQITFFHLIYVHAYVRMLKAMLSVQNRSMFLCKISQNFIRNKIDESILDNSLPHIKKLSEISENVFVFKRNEVSCKKAFESFL